MKPDAEMSKEILKEALDRFEIIHSTDNDNRQNYKADLAFVYSPGAQWPDDVRTRRTGWQELCLEFNQLKQFVAQVVNDQLQNRPGIRIHPGDGEASEDTAKIIQGMVRSIETDSNADDVYKNGFKLAVAGGRGWWRLVSEYESEDGFNQKLVIKPIQDSNTVFADNDYEQPDASDRRFVFVTTKLTKEEFLRQYPNAEPMSWDNLPAYWADGADTVVIADYYRRVCRKRTRVLMSDGAQGWLDEMPTPPLGIVEQMRREVEQWSVEWYTLAGGQQVLEQHYWPGSIIPVIQCAGEDIILDGKRVFQGLTRHARDAQSMLNFGMTQQATQLALSPRAPWVMAEGQNENYEQMWRDANTKNWSTLIYKPVTVDGQLAPPPQRTQPAVISEGWDRWTQTMIGMIKSTIGMYEQSLGQKGNEVSGRAIVAREKQGDNATFNYVNNWHMAIALTGRAVVEVLPKFYDTERIVTTIGPDDTKKQVKINQAIVNPTNDDPLGAIRSNDITRGRYAVTIDAGPSFATKRQETSEALQGLVQAFPEVMQVAGDLVVKSMDIADAEVIADRLKLALPPAVQQAEAAKAEGKTPPDPQLMAKMQEQQQHLDQAAQTMDAMHAKIQELESGVAAKVRAAEIDARLKAEQAQRDAQLEALKAKASAEQAIQAAQISASVDLEKAQIDSQTQIRKAIIDRATKLEIAEMQAGVDMAQAHLTAQTAQEQAETAEHEARETGSD